VFCPNYDFATHSRTCEVTRIPAARFVIVEGLFALYWPEVRALLGTRVYVDTRDEVCFERRLARDTRERGRTEESVRRQYAATVRPMAELHVWPTRRYADVIVSGESPLAQTSAAVLAHAQRAFRFAVKSW
jgi:uridine kinase